MVKSLPPIQKRNLIMKEENKDKDKEIMREELPSKDDGDMESEEDDIKSLEERLIEQL